MLFSKHKSAKNLPSKCLGYTICTYVYIQTKQKTGYLSNIHDCYDNDIMESDIIVCICN